MKNIGFTLVAVSLLAIGIGASAIIFRAVDALLLRALPVHRPAELVRMVQRLPTIGTRSAFFYTFYSGLRHSTTLAGAFGQLTVRAALTDPMPPEQVSVDLITPEYFDLLGVTPRYGRTLTASDFNEKEATPPAVLSYDFWRRRFNGDPHAVGRSIKLHGHIFSIVGVMSSEFNGISVESAPAIRVPLSAFPLLATSKEQRRVEDAVLEVCGRMKPGVSRSRAQDECRAIFYSTMKTYPKILSAGLDLEPLNRGVSVLRGRLSGTLRFLTALVVIIQVIICANLAGLFLARNASRSGELAVRLALGASRAQLVRQVLVEGTMLSAMSTIGALLIANFASPLVVDALPPIRDLTTNILAVTIDLRPDSRVLFFSLAASVLTVVLLGAAPAIQVSRMSADSILRGVRFRTNWRGRRALLIGEVALCFVLLSVAGLLASTFQELRGMSAGFDREHLATFTVAPSVAGYKADQLRALRLALVARVQKLPGVRSTGTASIGVMRGSGIKMTVVPEGQRATDGGYPNTSVNIVSPGYFDTMGMRIIAGRNFVNSDNPNTRPQKVLVNESFVHSLVPDHSAVGQRFGSGSSDDFVIIGVVTDAKYRSLREPMTPIFYSLADASDFVLYVRTAMRPEEIINPVRKVISALDPLLPVAEAGTLAGEVNASLAPERLAAVLASAFGVVAAILTTIGIYGLFTYMVGQRRHEIAIRVALGADSWDITEMIGSQVLAIVVVGLVLGLGAMLLLDSLIRSLLYGVSPTDSKTLIAASVLVGLIAVISAIVPILRIGRMDPSETLRRESVP